MTDTAKPQNTQEQSQNAFQVIVSFFKTYSTQITLFAGGFVVGLVAGGIIVHSMHRPGKQRHIQHSVLKCKSKNNH